MLVLQAQRGPDPCRKPVCQETRKPDLCVGVVNLSNSQGWTRSNASSQLEVNVPGLGSANLRPISTPFIKIGQETLWSDPDRFAFLSAIVCPWLDSDLSPRCPQVVWSHWGEIEQFSATLAQDGLVECDKSGKNPFKFSSTAGNWTRATERTDREMHSFSHWAIMTRATERTDSEIHQFSHLAIMTRATEWTDSEIHSFSHLAIVTYWENSNSSEKRT